MAVLRHRRTRGFLFPRGVVYPHLFRLPMKFPTTDLLRWYRDHRRTLPWRETREIYPIWVSEVMLQQTRVKTVLRYYPRFLKSLPGVQSLAAAGEDRVLKLWEGLGYYNRALNLHRAARMVVREYRGQIPEDPHLFRQLPGVGDYILAAVMSISCGYPLPAVDGNVLRVISRFAGIDDDIRRQSAKKGVQELLSPVIDRRHPGDFNQGLMELGARVCLKRNPGCKACPLLGSCFASETDQVHRFPRVSASPSIPEHRVAIAVIRRNHRFFIQQRPLRGHLGGLWEFPGGKVKTGETPAEAVIRECLEELGVRVCVEKQLTEVRHAYTHFKIRMSVFVCGLHPADSESSFSDMGRWITSREIDRYAFPAANHKFFTLLQQYLAATPAQST